MDDDLIMMMSRRPQYQPKQKYLFLSEKDTTVKGMFSEKYKGERENKDIPRPYKGDVPKSYSALGGLISVTPDAAKSSMYIFYIWQWEFMFKWPEKIICVSFFKGVAWRCSCVPWKLCCFYYCSYCLTNIKDVDYFYITFLITFKPSIKIHKYSLWNLNVKCQIYLKVCKLHVLCRISMEICVLVSVVYTYKCFCLSYSYILK